MTSSEPASNPSGRATVVDEGPVRSFPAGGHRARLTPGVEVATLASGDDEEAIAMFAGADAALYGAKRMGRNQVRTKGEEPDSLSPVDGGAPGGSRVDVVEGRA